VAAVPLRRTMSVSDAVLAHVQATDDVVVDAPAAVSGAAELASEIAEQLRNRGVQARILRCPDLFEHVDMECTTPPDTDISRRRFWTRTAVIGAGVISVAGSVVLAVPHDGGTHPDPVAFATPTELTWMVEGRVAVQVPAQWTVDRVVSGSGSARVQVISPTDPAQALHITQTLVPPGHTLEQAARSLRDAASGLPVGVVVDFNGGSTSAGRSAVTYREVRAGKVVDWSVVLDGPVRIAIGCQGAAARPHCETAVRSAHRVG
jgi:type VII secretion-associated protein (TIGR03931 family)